MLGFGKSKKNKEAEKKNEAEKTVTKEYAAEVESKINIHVMPERFRVAHVKKGQAKKTGVFIIVGGVLILIAVSAALYFFVVNPSFLTSKKPQTATSTAPAAEGVKTEEPPAAEEPKKEEPPVVEETPEESYKKIKNEFDLATNFSSYEAAIYKYGSQARIRLFEEEKRQYEGASESFRENMASLLVQQKMPKLTEIDIENSKAEIAGDRAEISVQTRGGGNSGTIRLLKEGNAWKLESESWADIKETEEEITRIEPSLKEGVDSDGDGLTDKEEVLLGADPGSIDSDGDGYGDLAELYNLYDPAGNKKLEIVGKINKYINNTYSYSFYYPSSWAASTVGGDFSVNIKSADNHFIQIMAEANLRKESIEEWYKRQFSAFAVDSEKIINGENWRGVKSDDGLTAYITDDEKVYIFTITYNPGTNDTMEYKNIYKTALDSFEINVNQ